MGKHTYRWLTKSDLIRVMRAAKRKKLGLVNPVFVVEEVIASKENLAEKVRNSRLLVPGTPYFHVTLTYD